MASIRLAGLAMLLLCLLQLGVPSPTAAQGTSVSLFPRQPLQFGTLLPGQAVVVPADDPIRHAEVEMVGSGQVTVTAELPEALVSPLGARLPLRFGPGDGRIVLHRGNRTTVFDPRQPVTVKLPQGVDGATLYLGGVAQSDPMQAAGSYAATIRVMIVSTGT